MNIAVNIDSKQSTPTIKGNFEAQEGEFDYWVDDIVGTVPADLSGSFYRNGPGRLKLGDQEFLHWFGDMEKQNWNLIKLNRTKPLKNFSI